MGPLVLLGVRPKRHRQAGLGSLLALVCAAALSFGMLGCRGKGAPMASTTRPATGPGPKPAGSWSLTSEAFSYNERIPAKYTCEGEDTSPDLSWTDPPTGAAELALICDDPDAPAGTWTHWVLYGMPVSLRALPAGIPTTGSPADLGGARQGRNSSGDTGYQGPCPPPGPDHQYHFRLYALDAPVSLPAGAERADLEKAMTGHIVGHAELVGLYSR